jgi:biopolymer transport protein ExbD
MSPKYLLLILACAMLMAPSLHAAVQQTSDPSNPRVIEKPDFSVRLIDGKIELQGAVVTLAQLESALSAAYATKRASEVVVLIKAEGSDMKFLAEVMDTLRRARVRKISLESKEPNQSAAPTATPVTPRAEKQP